MKQIIRLLFIKILKAQLPLLFVLISFAISILPSFFGSYIDAYSVYWLYVISMPIGFVVLIFLFKIPNWEYLLDYDEVETFIYQYKHRNDKPEIKKHIVLPGMEPTKPTKEKHPSGETIYDNVPGETMYD